MTAARHRIEKLWDRIAELEDEIASLERQLRSSWEWTNKVGKMNYTLMEALIKLTEEKKKKGMEYCETDNKQKTRELVLEMSAILMNYCARKEGEKEGGGYG